MKIQQTNPFRYWITSIAILILSFNSFASVDLSVDSILSPVSDCGISTLSFVEVKIHNHDSVPISNFPISYRINGGAPVTETITSSIVGGNSFNYTFTSTANLQTNGVYEIQVYVALNGDSIQMNDTLNKTVVNGYFQPITHAFTNLNDFEGAITYWHTYGKNNTWEQGIPNTPFINKPSSGVKAYVTNANGNYNPNEISYLESPCFDYSFFTITDPINVSFKLLFNLESDSDYVWMELSIDGGQTWSKALPHPILSINFYTDTSKMVWTGISNAGAGNYIPVLNSINYFGGYPKVKFRFVFHSNGTIQKDGFAIDRFYLDPYYVVTGLEETNSISNNLVLYPNPAKNNVTVSFNNMNSGIYEMTIEDVKGQKVVNDLISVSNGNTSKVIDVSQFESGVYFVKVVNGSSIITKKLVVN